MFPTFRRFLPTAQCFPAVSRSRLRTQCGFELRLRDHTFGNHELGEGVGHGEQDLTWSDPALIENLIQHQHVGPVRQQKS